jgi:hypothetical protein
VKPPAPAAVQPTPDLMRQRILDVAMSRRLNHEKWWNLAAAVQQRALRAAQLEETVRREKLKCRWQ